jgi:serine/threonine protein kinase
MEYCEWPTLESVMKSKTKLLESNVKLILCDLMNLINHLHTKGVCHRDIKPDNILVDIEKITKENF